MTETENYIPTTVTTLDTCFHFKKKKTSRTIVTLWVHQNSTEETYRNSTVAAQFICWISETFQDKLRNSGENWFASSRREYRNIKYNNTSGNYMQEKRMCLSASNSTVIYITWSRTFMTTLFDFIQFVSFFCTEFKYLRKIFRTVVLYIFVFHIQYTS